jgi:hypothetical protein
VFLIYTNGPPLVEWSFMPGRGCFKYKHHDKPCFRLLKLKIFKSREHNCQIEKAPKGDLNFHAIVLPARNKRTNKTKSGSHVGFLIKEFLMNTQQVEKNREEIHLARMSNEELHEHLKNRSNEERKLTHHILQLISEVDQRKLYLRMAYSSLFDYLTKELGYSAGSAQRRIDSARLLRQVPNLGNKIEDGSLNLSQMSQVQRTLRLARKHDNTELLPNEKEILLEKLQYKSGSETELILAQEFDLPIESQFKQKLQKDCSVRLELTLSKEQMEVLEQAKALLAHALSGGNLVDVIVHLAERYVKQRKGTSTATMAQASPRKDHRDQKSLRISVKKKVLNRDQGCQFKNRQTGKVCGSTYFAAYYYPHLLTLD